MSDKNDPSVSHWGPQSVLTGETVTINGSTYRVHDGEVAFQVQSIKDIGAEFRTLLETLPESRELALAKTKIDEAVMWAVKGVTK